ADARPRPLADDHPGRNAPLADASPSRREGDGDRARLARGHRDAAHSDTARRKLHRHLRPSANREPGTREGGGPWPEYSHAVRARERQGPTCRRTCDLELLAPSQGTVYVGTFLG